MIQIKEIYDYDESFFKCPFCDKEIGPEFDGDSTYGDIQICDHLLFLGTDAGFEICNNRVKKNLDIPLDEKINEYLEKYDETVFSLTSRIDLPGSIRIDTFAPSPSHLGVYYGFAK